MSTHQLIGNRFEIADPERDLLGRGGMGDVYRGRDLQSGALVAIKALRPEVVAATPDAITRFLREGEALRELNHPNIVKLVDAVEDADAGRHYLVIEYVPGGSLRDLLEEQGRLPIKRAVEIALEVADALTRAHHLGIIHRDLKPSNVLLADDGTPRLTDFGIVQLASSPRLTGADRAVGTVDYMSPEACNLEALDRRTDVWSFGVLLYEMLAGERPFGGESPLATLTAILTQPLPDLQRLRPDAPDALVDLAYRMLEKDRSARIPSVRMVGAELETILGAVSGQPSAVSTQSHLHCVPAQVSLSTTSRFVTPTSPAERPRHNLPAQTTPFIGRARELEDLDRLLTDPDVRLVTVLGPGGMGKTRLALEAAQAQVDGEPRRFPDGVYLVPLAPLHSPEYILSTVAEAVGFQFLPGREPEQQLLDYLREKRMLLLMDNYEHLLDRAGLVTEILQAAPGVQVLATSREKLNLSAETAYPIEGMAYPNRETPEDALAHSAIRLFLQGARRARPGYALRSDELKDVVRICKLVEGFPLGILLAAGWVDVLSSGEIAAEIEQNLDFLRAEVRDLPERQHSLRAVFESSWHRLGKAEHEAFARLSVFRGGFTREAAQAVTGASLRTLMALTRKSLLHRTPEGRYEAHEWLRQYARAELDETPGGADETLDLHCVYYAEFCHREAAAFQTGEQREALLEIDNLRTGWRWAIARRKAAEIRRFSDSLLRVYDVQGWYQEAEALWGSSVDALRADEAVGERGIALGSVLVRQAWLSGQVDHAKGMQLAQEGLSILRKLGARRELAQGNVWAVLLSVPESNVEAKRLLEESLAIYGEVRDLAGMGITLSTLGELALQQGAYREAERHSQEALRIGRETNNLRNAMWALAVLGRVSSERGEYVKARQFYEDSLALAEKTQHRRAAGNILSCLGDVACATGDYEEARKRYREAYVIYKEIAIYWAPALVGGYWGMVPSLNKLGDTALAMGDCTEAKRHYGQALNMAVDKSDVELRLDVLVRQAMVLSWERDKEEALELAALILGHPASSEATRERADRLLGELQAQLSPAVSAAVQERGKARDLETALHELLAELEG